MESSAEAQETENAAETETEPVEEMVQTALEHYRYTVDDLNSLLNSLRAKAQTAGQERGGGSFGPAEYRLVRQSGRDDRPVCRGHHRKDQSGTSGSDTGSRGWSRQIPLK